MFFRRFDYNKMKDTCSVTKRCFFIYFIEIIWIEGPCVCFMFDLNNKQLSNLKTLYNSILSN